MLYQYNGKTYIKPFSNRLVEVEISKKDNEYDAKATGRIVELTPKIKEEIVEISLSDAYKRNRKIERKITDTF